MSLIQFLHNDQSEMIWRDTLLQQTTNIAGKQNNHSNNLYEFLHLFFYLHVYVFWVISCSFLCEPIMFV